MQIKIIKEFEDLIPPLMPEERQRLESSIIKEGIREPLILWNNTLVDGHNRHSIAKKHNVKFETQQKDFKDKEEALLWMINNQLGRRNISPYSRTILALKYEEIIKPKAELQMKAGKTLGLNDPRVNTRKQIAEIANVGEATVSKVKYIQENATKEQKNKLTTQEDSINKIYHKVRKEKAKEEQKAIPLPRKKFGIIYADPPWRYHFSQTNERSIETHYKSMSLDEIKEIKIPSDVDAVLFLWATAPKIKEALEVMEAWGFTYKTNAVWDKEMIGMGYWFRGQHEILLVGTKGKVMTPNEQDRVSSVIRKKRGKHSEKPETVYEIIEKMFPKEKKIELFARGKRLGWEVWGNEV